MRPDFSLAGQRALVTGARRGLGRAIAAAMVACGARVAISHEGPGDAAEAAVTAAAIGAAAALPADLTDPDAAPALIRAAADALGGPLRLLVLNAAYERRVALDAMRADDTDRHFAVNLRANLDLIRAARPALRDGGRILVLGSVQARHPNPNQVAYAASKAALANTARNLARQLAPEGIAINLLSPGAVETEGNAAALADPATRAVATARVPMGRLGTPQDGAGAAGYVTGAELVVDGGWSA